MIINLFLSILDIYVLLYSEWLTPVPPPPLIEEVVVG